MRILIAEDEKRLAGAIARGLRREGMAVDITHDGASALVKARVVQYDVVVLDRDLPELHGDEVCRRLSTDERETKVLILTAADTTDDLVDGLALGADDYLPKPFHWPELVARIRDRKSTRLNSSHQNISYAVFCLKKKKKKIIKHYQKKKKTTKNKKKKKQKKY